MSEISVSSHDGRNDGRAARAGHKRDLNSLSGGNALYNVTVIGSLKHIRQAMAFFLCPDERVFQRFPRTIWGADDAALIQPQKCQVIKVFQLVAGFYEMRRVGECGGR